MHFVGSVTRIGLIMIDLTSLKMPGVSRAWFYAFFSSPNRPECTVTFRKWDQFPKLCDVSFILVQSLSVLLTSHVPEVSAQVETCPCLN